MSKPVQVQDVVFSTTAIIIIFFFLGLFFSFLNNRAISRVKGMDFILFQDTAMVWAHLLRVI